MQSSMWDGWLDLLLTIGVYDTLNVDKNENFGIVLWAELVGVSGTNVGKSVNLGIWLFYELLDGDGMLSFSYEEHSVCWNSF